MRNLFRLTGVVIGLVTAKASDDVLSSPSSSLRGLSLDEKYQRDPSYPSVFTAVVPAPGKENPDDVVFAAEVDLLRVLETGLPSPYDGSGSDYVKISFFVHDSDELQHLNSLLRSMSPGSDPSLRKSAPHLELDPALSKDLQDELNYKEDNYEAKSRMSSFSTIRGFSCYKDLAGTFDWMVAMAERADSIPNLEVTLEDIGDSYLKTTGRGGYDIMVMVITGNGVAAAGRSTQKSVTFLMTGIHAREYSPPELASRWAEEELIEKYGSDPEITAILDHTEIHIVFQSNPDGRAIAESRRWQLWRKNANFSGRGVPCVFPGTRGVDLNRNFPFKWGERGGSSTNKCSQTYRGPSAGSEPEVQAIVNYCESIFPTSQRKDDPENQKQQPYREDAMGVFFDIHSFGDLIIWPWTHRNEKSGNDNGMTALANKYKHFNDYVFAGPQQPDFLYPAAGVSDDWAYGALGAAGFTFELGTSFYQQCGYFENNILEKNKRALTYAAKISRAPYSLPKGPDIISTSVQRNGNSLSVSVTASDEEWSVGNHPTSRQGVSEIRGYIDEHPYDSGQLSSQFVISSSGSGTATIDISGLTNGKHTLYFVATDGDDYDGPVTAVSFQKSTSTKEETPPSKDESKDCADSDDSFPIAAFDGAMSDKDCDWLSINMKRFEFLCEFIEVAITCPLTCGVCHHFS